MSTNNKYPLPTDYNRDDGRTARRDVQSRDGCASGALSLPVMCATWRLFLLRFSGHMLMLSLRTRGMVCNEFYLLLYEGITNTTPVDTAATLYPYQTSVPGE
jgi:hypothetical protein